MILTYAATSVDLYRERRAEGGEIKVISYRLEYQINKPGGRYIGANG